MIKTEEALLGQVTSCHYTNRGIYMTVDLKQGNLKSGDAIYIHYPNGSLPFPVICVGIAKNNLITDSVQAPDTVVIIIKPHKDYPTEYDLLKEAVDCPQACFIGTKENLKTTSQAEVTCDFTAPPTLNQKIRLQINLYGKEWACEITPKQFNEENQVICNLEFIYAQFLQPNQPFTLFDKNGSQIATGIF